MDQEGTTETAIRLGTGKLMLLQSPFGFHSHWKEKENKENLMVVLLDCTDTPSNKEPPPHPASCNKEDHPANHVPKNLRAAPPPPPASRPARCTPSSSRGNSTSKPAGRSCGARASSRPRTSASSRSSARPRAPRCAAPSSTSRAAGRTSRGSTTSVGGTRSRRSRRCGTAPRCARCACLWSMTCLMCFARNWCSCMT